MSRQGQLLKNTIIISFGTFLPKIINVITLPIITAYLTKAEYGNYDLITTLVFLALPITTLQIQSAAFRFLIDYRDNKEKSKEIISTIILFAFITSVISVIVISFILIQISILMRILIALYFLLDLMLAVMQQITRGLSKNKAYSISTIISSTVSLIGILLTVQFMGYGLSGVMISMNVATFLGILFLFVYLRLWDYIDTKSFNKKTLKELLGYSWPMIPNNLSNWVLKLSDRLIITAVLGIEANAVYAVANKIPNLFTTVQATFVFAWQENASLAVNDKDVDDYYSGIFDSIFRMLVGIMSLSIAATPLMFKILIQGDYDDAYYQMPILFIGMMFSCIASVLGGIYVAHKKTLNVGISTMVAAVCNLIIDIACVNFMGITAGSVSTLVSYLILTIYRMIDVQKIQKIKYKYTVLIFWMIILIGMCAICEINNFWLNIFNVPIGIVVCYFSNRKLIKNLPSIIKKKLKGDSKNENVA